MSSKNRPFGQVKSIKAFGKAKDLISRDQLGNIVDTADFKKCSGSWRGQQVQSLYGASATHDGKDLTLIADSHGDVTVYKTSEIGVLAAAMGITNGATSSDSSKSRS